MSKFSSFIADLAETLSEKKIQILVAGTQAELCYDNMGKPSILVLPEPKGEITDEQIRLYNGYVDHEISHVEYTNINVRSLFKRKYANAKIALFIGQIAEDCHIEIRRTERWRGSQSNLLAIFEVKLWSEFKKEFVSAYSIKEQLQNFLTGAPSFIRALSGMSGHSDFLEQHRHTCPHVLAELEKHQVKLPELTTEGAMAFAEWILTILTDLSEQNEPEEDPDEEDDQTDEESESDAEEQGQNGNEGLNNEAGEPQSGDSNPGGKTPLDLLEDSAELDSGDVGDALAMALSSDEPDNEAYAIYSKAYDRHMVNILDCIKELGIDPNRIEQFKLPANISLLASKLQRLIQGQTKTGWEGGLITGRLDPKRISSFALGNDKLFRRRADQQDKSSAAMILVDMSYSMTRGKRIEVALQSAYALSLVMQSAGITHSVVGHTTVGEKTKGRLPLPLTHYLNLEGTQKYTRIQPLLMPEIKSWQEAPKPSKFGFYNIEELFMDNVDGEVIDMCCSTLIDRPETNKLLFVISDGSPDAVNGRSDIRGAQIYQDHLIEVINKWKNKIKIGALGIQTNSVEKFYPVSAVVNSVETMPETLMDLFVDMALKK